MIEQSLILKLSAPGLADSTTSRLRQEYQAYQKLFQQQTTLTQQYLGTQAASMAEAIIQGLPQAHFTLPNQIVCPPMLENSGKAEDVPADIREQNVRGLMDRLTKTDLCTALGRRFSELEQSENQAISVSAGLLRYAIAFHLIHHVLPAGRSVVYANPENEDIPNQPIEKDLDQESAISVHEERLTGENQADKERGELVVPYVEAARRFYMPQWVAFDGQGHLALGSLREAEAAINSMENYLFILNSAVVIAPYMIADEMCQQKRYGILGQLVNQGRALAHYQSQEIIQTIKRRVAEHRLDRGLRLSLPYFNDQTLSMEEYDFVVIPAGRVMFVPAFVVLAVQQQGAKVAQDTHFSQSTRKHLLSQLSKMEQAFLR